MKRLTLLAAGVLLVAGCVTNPITGRKGLVLTTPEEELSLGAQAFAEVRKTERISNDPQAIERVRRVGSRIAQAVATDMPQAVWEFVVFDSPDANAFALPGGKVGVYTGLLHLATSDDELAAVIGHEIGHVVARHGAERASRAQVASGVGELVSAGAQTRIANPQMLQVIQMAYGAGYTVLGALPHSRSQESEADHMGLVYAARAGYDPRAAISFWQKMIAQKKASSTGGLVEKLLSTHPADQDRIRDLEALMPSVLAQYPRR